LARLLLLFTPIRRRASGNTESLRAASSRPGKESVGWSTLFRCLRSLQFTILPTMRKTSITHELFRYQLSCTTAEALVRKPLICESRIDHNAKLSSSRHQEQRQQQQEPGSSTRHSAQATSFPVEGVCFGLRVPVSRQFCSRAIDGWAFAGCPMFWLRKK
jgi:hypothetical protein